MTLEDIIKKFN